METLSREDNRILFEYLDWQRDDVPDHLLGYLRELPRGRQPVHEAKFESEGVQHLVLLKEGLADV